MLGNVRFAPGHHAAMPGPRGRACPPHPARLRAQHMERVAASVERRTVSTPPCGRRMRRRNSLCFSCTRTARPGARTTRRYRVNCQNLKHFSLMLTRSLRVGGNWCILPDKLCLGANEFCARGSESPLIQCRREMLLAPQHYQLLLAKTGGLKDVRRGSLFRGIVACATRSRRKV
jgi:hypothetical protein